MDVYFPRTTVNQAKLGPHKEFVFFGCINF